MSDEPKKKAKRKIGTKNARSDLLHRRPDLKYVCKLLAIISTRRLWQAYQAEKDSRRE